MYIVILAKKIAIPAQLRQSSGTVWAEDRMDKDRQVTPRLIAGKGD